MKIIDFHTHNFPDSLAKRAIDGMLAKLGGILIPVGDGTLGRQLADMVADGVDVSVVCPVATKPEQADVILRRACDMRDGALGENAARHTVPFASVHPDDPDLKSHVDAIVRAGIKGVKLHPYYQHFALHDPERIPFFRTLADAGLVVVCHCGLDPGYPKDPIECGPRQIAAMLKAVPDIAPRFVAAHLGGFSGAPDHATDILLDLGCMIDTAVLAADQPLAEPRRIISEWPASRMVFGTDYYWTSQRQLIEWVKSLRPDPQDLELIFHGNAERLLDID